MNLAVIFGSRSAEHDVSIITAAQLMGYADKAKYNVIPVYISRDGKWYTGDVLKDIKAFEDFSPDRAGVRVCYIAPVPGENFATVHRGAFGEKTAWSKLDVAIPALHGMHGEDGTIQGLLELADIPYTSTGVVGSAVGMDKIVMKSVFKANGFPVLEGCHFERREWEKDPDAILSLVESKLSYPVFVKPANLGSSIGISKAVDKASLKDAIAIAAAFDRRILVEEAAKDIIELNCSCLGFGLDCRASAVEQPSGWEEYLTFDDKYMRSDSGKGMQALSRKVPAPIDGQLKNRIEKLSVDIFKALDCKGVVRIDYLFDRAKAKLYVNEINTIPGSMAFYLWDALGIPFDKLIDEMVECALSAHREKHKNTYAYNSKILKKAGQGIKSTGRK